MVRHDVANADEVAEGGVKLVCIDGLELGVFRVGGELRAYRNLCPHAGAPVCTGPLAGHVLRCPWHGWEFDLNTGKHLVNPAIRLESYPVEVAGGRVFVLA